MFPLRTWDNSRDLYQQIGNVDTHQLQLADGAFVCDMDIDLSDLSSEGVDPAILDLLQVSIDWKLTPPGEIGANNADQVVDGTLVWHLQTGQVTHLHAESQLASPTVPPTSIKTTAGIPNLLWIIGLVLSCVLVLVLLGALVIALIMRPGRGQSTRD